MLQLLFKNYNLPYPVTLTKSNQVASNGLEHVGMETSYMHIQDKLYKFCFKYYDAKATKPPCEVKESFPKIIKVAITPGQLKIYT